MPAAEVTQSGILDLVANAGWVVKFVLLLLVFSSVVCWAVILAKFRLLKLATKTDESFLSLFWRSKSLEDIYSKSEKYSHSPVARVFKSGFKELQKLSATGQTAADEHIENIQRSLNRAAGSAVANLEKHLGWLATTASAAPFIGLFGTVWGIMNSFQQIGATGAANLAVVAPGISEALIATAIGLAAAIPAVIFYNHFANQIRRIAVDMDCFCQDFLNIIQRGFIGGTKKK